MKSKNLYIAVIIVLLPIALFAQWESDQRLTFDDSVSCVSTNWCVAASGETVHVVWKDQRDGNSEIYYKRNPTGNQGIKEVI
jgi:hypothetical protein